MYGGRPTLLQVDVLLEAGATLGEGPAWDAAAGRLLWVDILGHLVHSLDPATGQDTTINVGQPVGAIAPRMSEGWVMAVEAGFALGAIGEDPIELIVPLNANDPSIRFNDGKCDPAGRFWAGTMAYDARVGAGSLYRLDSDHRVRTMLTGATISNGLAWSPDHRTMYYIDTPTQGVDAFTYDIESGSIQNRRRVVEIPPAAGMPDGMTIDAEGGLWVALWGGSSVHRYLPNGELDRIVNVPTSHVTSCAFGGTSLEDLYITSARMGLSATELANQPYAGAVFACRPGIQGTTSIAFAG